MPAARLTALLAASYCAAAADAVDYSALKAQGQGNYWILAVAPADNLLRWHEGDVPSPRFTMGKGAAGEYRMFGEAFQKLGFGRVFQNDTTAALAFLNDRAGRDFATWDDLAACGASADCGNAFATDPALEGKSATVTSIVTRVNARETMRCHAHPGALSCHEKTAHFNRGVFFVVRAVADGEDVERTGLVMCHKWDAAATAAFTNLQPCHAMPHGLVVRISDAAMPVLNASDSCPDFGECCGEGEPCCAGLTCQGQPWQKTCVPTNTTVTTRVST